MNYMDEIARKIGFDCYAQYLRSRHLAHMIVQHRGRACFCCGGTHGMQLHHNTYDQLGAELPTNLTTVCSSCHERIHGLVACHTASLDNAHFVLKRKIQKYGTKSPRRERGWVTNWRQLGNHSKKQTITELESFLVDKELLSIVHGPPCPTAKAFKLRFAKVSGDGRAFWNLGRYITVMRADHKLQKEISKGKEPHPALLRRALASRDGIDAG